MPEGTVVMGTRPLLVPWGACYPELALLPSALQMVTHGSLYDAATKCTFVGPMHSEAKQYQNVRVWSGERFIAGLCKETGGSCPLKSRTPQRLSAKHFKRQGEGGMWLVVANFLVLESFVLAVVHISQLKVFL